ncbi:hypothetical protein [Nocardia carnea]|uniref:hypothetical protein n=1 Tax=Nocardia carnea TaxID=37328 RepID=UPI002454C046|nr:hypothetical protein [Nocardia carnea]
MSMVRLSTELPIPARDACLLAQRPELFEYVVAPLLRTPDLDFPDPLAPGVSGSARLWWFGIVPSWTHHLTLIHLGPTELFTNESGGPVRVWNHRLIFTAIDENRCRYTDEIEVEDGWRGLGIRLFAELMFRHRHRRWRELTRVLAASGWVRGERL